jgi:hypothetical protein
MGQAVGTRPTLRPSREWIPSIVNSEPDERWSMSMGRRNSPSPWRT